MDMTKELIDFEQNLDAECEQPSDYTKTTPEATKVSVVATLKTIDTQISKEMHEDDESLIAMTENKDSNTAGVNKTIDDVLDEPMNLKPTKVVTVEGADDAEDEAMETAIIESQDKMESANIRQTPSPSPLTKLSSPSPAHGAIATVTATIESSTENILMYKTRSGELTPPPRPFTSSEVVGLTDPIDPELRVELNDKKSRSLPVSPQPTSLVAQHLNAAALYEFESVDRRSRKPELSINNNNNHNSNNNNNKQSLGGASRKMKAPQHATVNGTNANSQQFCLRWNNYQSNLTNVFDELLQNESFVDVTLACEGHSIKAHKMVLSACSPYFQALFYDNPCQHPIIIMRDVNWSDLKALVDFMYKGEINVCQEQINPLLKLAETLKIRGLAEVSAGAHGGGAGLAGTGVAAHPMLPEQRMTVYGDEDEDDDERESMAPPPPLPIHEVVDDLDEDYEDEAGLKPKRARLIAKLQAERACALDLNLNAARQRKRSRDGHLLLESSAAASLLLRRSRTPSPVDQHQRIDASPSRRGGTVIGAGVDRVTPIQTAAIANPRDEPISMTTSTIVRNPFASPNPQAAAPASTANATAASSSSSSSTSASSGGSSSATSSSSSTSSSASSSSSTAANAAYQHHQQQQQQQHQQHHHRSIARSCSPPTAHSNGSASLASPTGGSANQHHHHHHQQQQQQMPLHITAVSSGHHGVNPTPSSAASTSSSSSMHHHAAAAAAAAHQLAAQHQLHAAAHSHAAMASALGASLAAAAAGGSGSSGASASVAGGIVGSGPGGGGNSSATGHHEEMEIKPEIAEMIREEERAKMIESGGHPWISGGATTSSVADSYQYQLQSMWQKCWNTNQQNLVQQLRFRERGPLKSWRPEAMAEAIFSVLKEGLSLSQAARKYDIPYPTFVLYANRVHNMLGPSLDGGTDPRPKARGRPQRILLGMWPEELIRSVIKAVVFRDYREIKEEMAAGHPYANGQGHVSPFGPSVGNSAAVVAAAANGYHNAAKLSAALVPPDANNSPLSSMTETLRRQILSQQQQQSPMSQSMNMYKSPAYLQRSEIEDQVSAAAAVAAAKQQQSERRGSENLPDLSALGLMGIPGLNVIPTSQRGGGSASSQMHSSYARERERELTRDRERERERELKEAMQARQYGNPSRSSSSSGGGAVAGANQKAGASSSAGGAASPFSLYSKHKEHPNYAYNKRFLESLPPGIDFEAIANGFLQKSVNKSPRFEDFFPGQDMSELFASAESAAAVSAAGGAAGGYPGATGGGGIRESPLMKIKLEQQQAAEVPHED